MQADTLTVYEGEYFTGNEFYCTSDCGNLGNLDLDASSMIITGTSPWTVYDGQNYSGNAICVYPNETDCGQRLPPLAPLTTPSALPGKAAGLHKDIFNLSR